VAFRIAGTPIDLNKIKQPMYVLGAENDHIAPWKGSYLTTQHVGGEVRYTLTSSGHVAGIVNPPGNPKAAFWTRPHTDRGLDAEAWREGAERVSGSWWDDWVAWAAETVGGARRTPAGSARRSGAWSYAKGEDGPAFKARSSARRSQRARGRAAAKNR